jgi:hypothetical protein
MRTTLVIDDDILAAVTLPQVTDVRNAVRRKVASR